MNNDECVLFEFENGERRVGFRSWIQDEEKTSESRCMEMIRNASLVSVIWPNCVVEPAARMKTKTKHCSWVRLPAKVIAYGEWLEMCEARKNGRSSNPISLEKAERKVRAKKHVIEELEGQAADSSSDETLQSVKSEANCLGDETAGITAAPAPAVNSQNSCGIYDRLNSKEARTSLYEIFPNPPNVLGCKISIASRSQGLRFPCTEGISIQKPNEPDAFLMINFRKRQEYYRDVVVVETNPESSAKVPQAVGKESDNQGPDVPFTCDECDKTFRAKKYLNAHKKKIHEERSLHRKLCGICGKHFTQIRRHLRTHMLPDGRIAISSTCPYCRLKLSYSNFQRHLKRCSRKSSLTGPL